MSQVTKGVCRFCLPIYIFLKGFHLRIISNDHTVFKAGFVTADALTDAYVALCHES